METPSRMGSGWVCTSHEKTLANGMTVSLKFGPRMGIKGRSSGMVSGLRDVDIVKNRSWEIIWSLTPLLNSLTCRRMYLRKASLDHLPRSMMVYTGTLARYMAIAAPLRAEWSPTLSGVNPNSSSPRVAAARRILYSNSFPENLCIAPSAIWKEFTVHESEADG